MILGKQWHYEDVMIPFHPSDGVTPSIPKEIPIFREASIELLKPH